MNQHQIAKLISKKIKIAISTEIFSLYLVPSRNTLLDYINTTKM